MKIAASFFICVFTACSFSFGQDSVKVSGRITDKDTGKPVTASIVYGDSLNKALNFISCDSNGYYSLQVPQGKTHYFSVLWKTYLMEEFEVKASVKKEVVKDIALTPMIICHFGPPVKWLIFGYNSAVVLPESIQDMEKMLRLLKENPHIGLELWGIAGHKEKNPRKLAGKRADMFYNYLVNNGIEKKRLILKENLIEEFDKDNRNELYSGPSVEFTVFEVEQR